MRVGILAPIAWRTPPKHYGPWEQVTSLLTEGLVARGVDVTLFATGDSLTSARLEWVCPEPYAEDPQRDGRVWEAMHVAHALASSGRVDLIHNHLDWLPLAFSQFCTCPMVTTIHGFSDPANLPAYQASKSTFVSISDADRAPGLTYLRTVQPRRGSDRAAVLRLRRGGSRLARSHPPGQGNRRGHRDQPAGRPSAGHRRHHSGPALLRHTGPPFVDDDQVVYLGSVGPARRAEILGGARALLHPIAFAEPFGLSVVESMVCGTPVIAYPRGAMPEIIDPGRTGFLVTGVDDAAAAVERVGPLNRQTCHDIAARRFGADRMVDDYRAVYEQVLGCGG